MYPQIRSVVIPRKYPNWKIVVQLHGSISYAFSRTIKPFENSKDIQEYFDSIIIIQ